MDISIKLTVFFDGTFWIGIFERTCEDSYEISKVVFGAEPKDYEIDDFLLKNFYKLRFSNSLTADKTEERKINPKRLQREIRKETQSKGLGTKAQNALKLQYETYKKEKKEASKEKEKYEKERQIELRKEKKREKHNVH